MKKTFTFSLILAAISFLIFGTLSCNTKSVPRKQKNNYSTKKMLLSYLEQHRKIDTGSSLFIDTLIKKSDWNNYLESEISNDVTSGNPVTLFYVPFNYNKNKTGVTFLYYPRLRQVYYALITEFPNIKNRIFNKISCTPVDIITGFYKNNLNKYTGSIRAFSLSNNFLWEYGYKKGKNEFQRRITSVDPNDTTYYSDNKNVLIKYHVVTYYEKINRKTNFLKNYRFIGTTYENDPFKITIGLSPDSVRIKTKPNNYNKF